MSKKIRTHYDNLKVLRHAPEEVIKAAHKALVQKHHPDRAVNKSEAERIMKIVNEARDVLLDPQRKKEHDEWIRAEEARHQQSQHHESPTAKPSTQSKQEQRLGHFTISGGIATDTRTGLMWLRFAHGQTWQNDTVQGEAKIVDWHSTFNVAKQFNDNGGYAGFTDWQLPTIEQLKTLIDKQKGKSGNYIDAEVFPQNYYRVWSSSPSTSYHDNAWSVIFDGGDVYHFNRAICFAVRLVRGGQ